MNKIFKLCALFTLLFAMQGSLCASNNNAEVQEGKVVYSFESGKMECLSEIDAAGHTWVLIRSLDKNTRVEFNKIERYKGDYVAVLTMFVNDTSICASWITTQEVKIVIHPTKVETRTLSGKIVSEKNDITIMRI